MKYNTNINHNSTHKSDFVVKEDTQGHNFSYRCNLILKQKSINAMLLSWRQNLIIIG